MNENVPLRLSSLLASIGINAVHTILAGNQGASDEEQLQYAANNRYILLTHNRRHFRRLHGIWLAQGKEHSGIIVTRPTEPELLAGRLKRFFDEVYPTLRAPFCLAPPPEDR